MFYSDGKCAPTSKKFAKYNSGGFYEAGQHGKHGKISDVTY